jgi:serine protease Do
MKRVKHTAYILVFLSLVWGLSTSCEKQEETPPPTIPPASELANRTQPEISQTPLVNPRPVSFAVLAQTASPSVVNISVTKVIETGPFNRFWDPQHPFREFFERFFGEQVPRKFKQQSLGSGFIIDAEGFILTNNHVVEQTDEITVTLNDEREFKATIVGRDPKTDLALIRIDPDGSLTPLPLGDSNDISVGDWVMAIGNPFGLGHTVTAGIVSAKYRRIGLGAYDDFIQTDASINPGNSGGPLLNTKGEAVGISTAIFSRTGANVGIGFATPINMAKDLLPQLKEGKVIRGWLGVTIQKITPELKEKLDLKTEKAALVADVSKGSPADKSGMKRGDVIISFDGKAIEETQDLPYIVALTPVGKEVAVKIIRKGKEMELQVKVGEMKEEEQA